MTLKKKIMFSHAKQSALMKYYKPKKTKRMATKKKAADPQKKLLITAIKKTILKNSSLPILETICLREGKAIVSDLETSVVIPYESGINACIDSNKFIDCLEMMEPAFSQNEHLIEVKEKNRVVKLSSQSPEEFPRIPLIDKDYPVIGFLMESDMGKLQNALSFVSNDDLRLTGVLLGKEIAATDGHRLYFDKLSEEISREFILPAKAAKILLALGGEWKVSTEEEYKKDEAGEIVLVRPTIIELHPAEFFYLRETDKEEGIFPRKGIREEALADYENRSEWQQEYSFEEWIGNDYPKIDPEEKIKVEVPDMTKEPVATLLDFDNVCFARNDGVKVVTRKIDARFPDYHVVIPSDEDVKVRLVTEKEFILKELKMAGKFCNKITNQVVFTLNGSASIESSDLDFDHSYSNDLSLAKVNFVDPDNHEPIKIAFNGNMLSGIIGLQEQSIEFKIWGPTKCAIINDHYLLMPLMINDN